MSLKRPDFIGVPRPLKVFKKKYLKNKKINKLINIIYAFLLKQQNYFLLLFLFELKN